MKFFRNKQIDFHVEWNKFTPNDLEILKTIFYKSFAEKAYKNLSSAALKLNVDYFHKKYLIANDQDIVKYFIKEIAIEEVMDIASGKLQCAIARLNGKIVGCATVQIKPETAFLYIDLFAVLPNYSSQGVGSSLMDSIKKRFSHLNGIILYTRKIATGAEIFYNKLGFEQKSLDDLQITIKADQYPGFISSITANDYIGFEFSRKKNVYHRHSLPEPQDCSANKMTI